MSDPQPVTWARCPDCRAVKWPGWGVTHRHRPPCRFEGTDPATWGTDE